MKASIDRIEGETAVLVTLEGKPVLVNVPVKLLPAGSREGDIITIGIERDESMTRTTKDRVRDLITTLKNKE